MPGKLGLTNARHCTAWSRPIRNLFHLVIGCTLCKAYCVCRFFNKQWWCNGRMSWGQYCCIWWQNTKIKEINLQNKNSKDIAGLANILQSMIAHDLVVCLPNSMEETNKFQLSEDNFGCFPDQVIHIHGKWLVISIKSYLEHIAKHEKACKGCFWFPHGYNSVYTKAGQRHTWWATM